MKIDFLVVGHTHEDVEQFFSRIRESILTLDGNVYALFTMCEVSLRAADAFPVVASLPPKEEGEKRRPEMRLRFAG